MAAAALGRCLGLPSVCPAASHACGRSPTFPCTAHMACIAYAGGGAGAGLSGGPHRLGAPAAAGRDEGRRPPAGAPLPSAATHILNRVLPAGLLAAGVDLPNASRPNRRFACHTLPSPARSSRLRGCRPWAACGRCTPPWPTWLRQAGQQGAGLQAGECGCTVARVVVPSPCTACLASRSAAPPQTVLHAEPRSGPAGARARRHGGSRWGGAAHRCASARCLWQVGAGSALLVQAGLAPTLPNYIPK